MLSIYGASPSCYREHVYIFISALTRMRIIIFCTWSKPAMQRAACLMFCRPLGQDDYKLGLETSGTIRGTEMQVEVSHQRNEQGCSQMSCWTCSCWMMKLTKGTSPRCSGCQQSMETKQRFCSWWRRHLQIKESGLLMMIAHQLKKYIQDIHVLSDMMWWV